jgi:integrase
LGSGASRSTVAQRLAAIRSFHRWAAREGLTTGDPWGAIATPRLPRRLPRVLEVDEVDRLLAVIDHELEAADAAHPTGPHWRPPSRCGIGRSSRWPTRRACASASSPPRISGRSTSGEARSG